METEQDSLSLSPSNDSPVNRETTPEPKQTTLNNTNGPSCGDFDGSVLRNQNLTTDSPKQQLKKQIKRRILSRSYEEKLTNMAQVRREIVTALKIHRAMKEATVEQQQQQLPLPQQQQESLSLKTSNVSSLDQDGRINSRRNPSCNTKISNHMNDFSFSLSRPPPPNSYPNTSHAITSSLSGNPPPKEENPNLTLPNQTLGLNLNSHPFNNSEAPPPPFLNNSNNDNTNSSLCSYTSLTPSSPPLVTHDQDVSSIGTSHSQGEGVSSVVDKESNATIHHTAMDDEGMKEIRLLVKKHQMELDDTHSLITSTRWFNYLKNMEHGATHHEDGAGQVFDELNEFPTWLNYYENQVCLEQCSEDFQDPTLLW